jgi:hypothetical protein
MLSGYVLRVSQDASASRRLLLNMRTQFAVIIKSQCRFAERREVCGSPQTIYRLSGVALNELLIDC